MTKPLRYWRNYLWACLAAPSQKKLFGKIEKYCMFIGQPRSGHTLHGALLNAHPEMVVAHELDALFFVKHGISREQLYALLLKRDRWFGGRGRQWEGFGYDVPNQFCGRFEKLRVIGDKKGGRSSFRLHDSPDLLMKSRRIVGVPLRIFHIVRNPFDNISTMARRNRRSLSANIEAYFQRAKTDLGVLKTTDPAEVLTARHEDFIAQPEEYLKRYLDFLGLEGADSYFSDCAKIVVESPSKSRFKAPWDNRLKAEVYSRMEEISFLHGYTFDN